MCVFYYLFVCWLVFVFFMENQEDVVLGYGKIIVFVVFVFGVIVYVQESWLVFVEFWWDVWDLERIKSGIMVVFLVIIGKFL